MNRELGSKQNGLQDSRRHQTALQGLRVWRSHFPIDPGRRQRNSPPLSNIRAAAQTLELGTATP